MPSYKSLFTVKDSWFPLTAYDRAPYEKLEPFLSEQWQRQYVFERAWRAQVHLLNVRRQRNGVSAAGSFRLDLEEEWKNTESHFWSSKPDPTVPSSAKYDTSFWGAVSKMPGTPESAGEGKTLNSKESALKDIVPREGAYLDTLAMGIVLSVWYSLRRIPNKTQIANELKDHFEDHEPTLQLLDTTLKEAGLGPRSWLRSSAVTSDTGSEPSPWSRPTGATKLTVALRDICGDVYTEPITRRSRIVPLHLVFDADHAVPLGSEEPDRPEDPETLSQAETLI